MSWTDERVETLKKMWADGQSASQIAKELGGVTRNAVIGKVHRLGLSNRVGGKATRTRRHLPLPRPLLPQPRRARNRGPRHRPPSSAPRPSVRRPERAAPPAGGATVTPLPTRKAIIPAGQPLPPQPSANEISPEALASVREVEKRARRLTLMELTERTCKWPIGDPATDDFWFCGLPDAAGQAVLRGPCRRGVPADERTARPAPVTIAGDGYGQHRCAYPSQGAKLKHRRRHS